jgi:dihydroorotate dehydrogenase electron transfer subunit
MRTTFNHDGSITMADLPPHPSQGLDGTLTAVLLDKLKIAQATVLRLALPPGLAQLSIAGRYVLARCGASTPWERRHAWHIYLRRSLFAIACRPSPETSVHDIWDFLLPSGDDPGYCWLAEQPAGASINLIGPLGRSFALPNNARNLLLLADLSYAPTLFPLAETMLDRGGRVTLILAEPDAAPLTPALPLAVEVHTVANVDEYQAHLDATVLWADFIAAATPASLISPLAAAIRRRRFHLEAGIAEALVRADLVCGTGACLACVVPTADGGYTRACVHGPVLDLTKLLHE